MDFRAAQGMRRARQLWLWWLLPLIVVGGWAYPALGYFLPLCMVVGMGIALFKGRYWCDWLCPRGGSWDLFLRRISRACLDGPGKKACGDGKLQIPTL